MQDNIKIFFNSNSEFTELNVSVNGNSVEYNRNENYIEVNIPQHHGVNILRTKLKNSNEQFEVMNVKINDCGIRMGLYLSYVEENGIKFQPRTEISTVEQEWVLPYGSPMSFWLSLISTKFKSEELGNNLYEKYEIYYPEPVELQSQFPQLIKDYFYYDFDFTVVDKRTATWEDIPYLPLLTEVTVSSAYQEIMDNLDYFYANCAQSRQIVYNQFDVKSIEHDHWIVWWFGRGQNYKEDMLDFPHLTKLISDLKIDGGVITGILAFTKPGSFASPHIDDNFLARDNCAHVRGCAQIYIPISPNFKNSDIKLAGVGTLPKQPVVFSSDKFMHGVYNDSDTVRISLSMRVDPNANPHLFKKPRL